MTRLRGILLAAAAAPLLLTGACAQTGTTGNAAGAAGSSSAAAGPLDDPDALVLRTESFGGFVPVEHVVGRIPEVSVYADGRVITQGPVPAIYPGPALPNLQVATIDQAAIGKLVREGLDAGVRTGADFGRPNVADAPSTRVTVVTAEGTQSVTAEALHEGQPDDPMLTAEQRAARTRLAAFVKKLQDLSGTGGQPYDAAQLAALSRPWVDPGSTDLPKQTAKAWPGPALPGAVLNKDLGIGCVIVSGAQQDKVLAAAKDANALTPWTSDYKKWSVIFRPLLPDEKNGCAVVKAAR